MYISEIKTTPPTEFKSELHKKVYAKLQELEIPFERVETDEIITMEDCEEVNGRLEMKMVKTLFLCNRKKTEFYLFITCGDKPFSSKNFSNALEISRVSFAPAELMLEMLGTKIGAATVFSVLLDSAKDVRLVIDRDVLNEEYYGCSDSQTTGYMKIKTSDIFKKLLPSINKKFDTVEV